MQPKEMKIINDGLSYSTSPKTKETRGNAITHPQSHPIHEVKK